MKKRASIIAALSFAMVLTFVLAGCTKVDSSAGSAVSSASSAAASSASSSAQSSSAAEVAESASLASIRQQAIDAGDPCAIAFLGYCDDEKSTLPSYLTGAGFVSEYPVIEEIPLSRVVENAGGEMYLAVPASRNASVTVNEWIIDESNDCTGASGRELYSSKTGDPIIIRGNISDVTPNLQLLIKDEKQSLDYIPCMSLKDGTLSVPGIAPSVLDITNYGLANPDPVGIGMQWLVGGWGMEPTYSNGLDYRGDLTINEDGTVTFAYGLGGVFTNYYSGAMYYVDDWQEVGYFDNTMSLSLWRESGDGPKELTSNYIFYWAEDLEHEMIMYIVSGDRLIAESESPNYYLVRSVG